MFCYWLCVLFFSSSSLCSLLFLFYISSVCLVYMCFFTLLFRLAILFYPLKFTDPYKCIEIVVGLKWAMKRGNKTENRKKRTKSDIREWKIERTKNVTQNYKFLLVPFAVGELLTFFTHSLNVCGARFLWNSMVNVMVSYTRSVLGVNVRLVYIFRQDEKKQKQKTKPENIV